MKKKTPGLFFLLAATVVLMYAVWQVEQVGDHLQYLVDAPALTAPADERTEPGRAITDLQESLASAAADWTQSMKAWTLGGVIQQTSLQADKQSAAGRMELLGENAFAAHPRYLLHGRLFYEDELKDGAHVILLDEQMALKLFAVADPIDRIVSFNDEEYRVVGVTRHAKGVGDYTEYGAYIPLNSVLDQTIQLDALMVESVPIPGSGAGVAFADVVKAWRPGGTVIDLGKESMAATLWLRVMLFAVGAALLFRLIRRLNSSVRKFIFHYKARLRTTYASRLLPWMIGRIGLYVLAYGFAGALAAWLMHYIIQPVYTFPEWIPTVLVEWDDIAAAFWNVWQAPAAVRELRTPELLRLRFFTLVLQACAAIAGAVCAMWFGISRSRRACVAESLRVLADGGAAASYLQTDQPDQYGEMGYVPCEGGAIRVLNAKRALAMMPGSAREGAFILAVEDEWIPANNRTFQITCHPEGNAIEETNTAYDLLMPVQTLTELIYGDQQFESYMESHVDFDLRMRSPAMEGFFAHHLTAKAG